MGWTWLTVLLLVISGVTTQDYNPYNPTESSNNPSLPYNPQYNPSQYNNQYNPTQYNNQYNPQFNFDQRQNGTRQRQESRRPQDSYNPRVNQYDASNVVITETTYFIVASRMVRPGQIYKVAVSIIKETQPLTIRASLQRNGVELSADSKEVKSKVPETLIMRVPPTSVPGDYVLRVEGLYENILGGAAFVNETKLTFSQRSMTIFVQLDKPVYMQDETIRLRIIPINPDLKAFDDVIDVFVLDPNGNVMRRWLSRQSNLGTVSLQYQLSGQPVFGEWKVRAIAQGQVEESSFLVEEYYQTRFEVNVTMPAFFFTTDEYLHGIVMANYTSGAPVTGNLTLKATIRPIDPLKYTGYVPHDLQPQTQTDDERRWGNEPEYKRDPNYRPIIAQKYFYFEEKLPFWYPVKDYYEPTPHMQFFYGVHEFKYPMEEIRSMVSSLEGMEVTITATVGERFYDEIIEGYSTARIFNSSIRVDFVGGSPQVFKPSMPVTCYLVAAYHDGSALSEERLKQGRLEVEATVEMRSGGGMSLPLKPLTMIKHAVWEYQVDLVSEFDAEGIDDPQALERRLNDVTGLRVRSYYRDGYGERADNELLMLAHHSPGNRHIKIHTSTRDPKVGEYLIVHIEANYYIESFSYLIISKGTVLVTGEETMKDQIRTMAMSLSAEMAPVATMVVWHVGLYGDIVADSLTFPVNGISRNKFQVFVNNKKARTGHTVEVAVYGEAGSYVGLSAIDRSFYTMQAGNDLSYAKVLKKMAYFDEQTNGSFAQTWFSHEGNPDEIVYFPSSSFGIDANRTFEFAGLVVFSDVVVPRRQSNCDEKLGYGECLNGKCYPLDKKCDGYKHCDDGTDEAGCFTPHNETELRHFRKYRFNRVQRQYESVWMWKDVNIGPHGRYIFNLPVPARPVHWMITAFSISPSIGFGMIPKAIEYIGVLPFFINVEMPSRCRQGEQIGIRVTVFNYMTNNIEATVVLNGSPDYKFVHVEEEGIVRSYNPRTSFGEHQFFIYIKAQDAVVVHMPVVPTRLGDIEITLHASALIGKDTVTRKLHVEADGVPQYRHQATLLDLSNRAFVFQYMHVNVTETPIIPYDADRYYVFGSNSARVSVVGDVVGPIFPTMPVNATSLLHLPMDCAEQNMFSFAANMYTTFYMRLISQRNKTLERLSFYYMNIGYQRQLSYMNQDGSFSLFRSDWNHSSPSVWLTAYCARIFQEASFYEWENYIYIDPTIVSKSIEWLLEHQTEDGSFYEVTWLPDRKYNRTVNLNEDKIAQRNISLTAHVLITLETVRELTKGLGAKVYTARDRAIRWLERNMKLLEDKGEAFDVAIVAYALMLSKASAAERAYAILSKIRREEGGLIYWGRKPVPQPPYKLENQKPFLLPRLPYEYDSENVEATSYALLTYVGRQELMSERIVMWLNAQRLTDGGWASTQDTGMAMKALIEYTQRERIRDVSNLTITVEATSLPGKTKVFQVNNENFARLQYIDIPEAWGTVKVEAKGAGYAILQMSVQYNVDIAKFQTEPPVRAFDLVTKADFHGRNQSHITYISCQKWINLNESERSGMAVLDVTIPTGYIIQQQKLDAYILSKSVRNLKRARYQEQKVLFYFEYLDQEEICLNLTIERWHPVANMSRYLPIRIYDYYAPERFNETIFDSLPTYLLNICEVCGSSQCPYCAIYNMAATLPIPFITIITTTILIVFRQLRLQEGVVL